MTTISDIRGAISNGSVSATSVVTTALEKLDIANKAYNVTIQTLGERSLQQAKHIDELISKGMDAGRLAGVPFIVKDNFLTFGGETTAGSNILKGFEAPYQATVIEKLENEGAICIAKANLDAFAHGGSTENSDFGPTLNPHDPSRVPGGSSGGSAAAVALDIVPFALGTDTGGSVRLPASFCGVVGIKPSYGLISRYGVVAMASSTDVISPLTHTVADAALIIDIIAGRDLRDGQTLHEKPKSFTSLDKSSRLKIGLIKEFMTNDIEPGVRDLILETAKKLKAAGHTVEEVSLPSLPLALAVYYIVIPAEISSNLARYDGIKYGYHTKDAKNLAEVYGKTRDTGFNSENKRRILIGTYVLSSGYYDAYYKKAQIVRTLIIKEFESIFENYDALLSPVSPGIAFKLGERSHDPLKMYLADIMTVASSLTGMPSMSVPVGMSQNMPVGAQLIAPYKQDDLLLNLGNEIQGLYGQ